MYEVHPLDPNSRRPTLMKVEPSEFYLNQPNLVEINIPRGGSLLLEFDHHFAYRQIMN